VFSVTTPVGQGKIGLLQRHARSNRRSHVIRWSRSSRPCVAAVLQRSGRSASNRRRQTKHIQKLLQNGTQSVQQTSECKNIEKLQQIRICQKSTPVFSLRKFTKSSHPSGGVTPPGRYAYFPGSRLFRTHVKKMLVTAHNVCRLWEKSTSYHSHLTSPAAAAPELRNDAGITQEQSAEPKLGR
jgi:hypothetical protein